MAWIIALKGNPDVAWSNANGWTEDDFDTFTDAERSDVRLPLDGEWVHIPDRDAADDPLLEAVRAFLTAWDDTNNAGELRVSEAIAKLRTLAAED